jgi:nitrogen fixation protein NifU and related proteins
MTLHMLTPEICEAILREHTRKPRHTGKCEQGRGGDIVNPLCGDELQISLTLDELSGRITCARFEGAGCAASQAGASLLMSALEGKTKSEVLQLTQELRRLLESGDAEPETSYDSLGEIAALLVFSRIPARVRCASLAADLVESLLIEK